MKEKLKKKRKDIIYIKDLFRVMQIVKWKNITKSNRICDYQYAAEFKTVTYCHPSPDPLIHVNFTLFLLSSPSHSPGRYLIQSSGFCYLVVTSSWMSWPLTFKKKRKRCKHKHIVSKISVINAIQQQCELLWSRNTVSWWTNGALVCTCEWRWS